MTDTISLAFDGLAVPASIHKIFATHFQTYFTTYYNRRADSLLNALCDKYGSDKGEIIPDGHPYPWVSHTYADVLERLFGHCREHVRYVFECGLGTNNPSLASSMGENGKPGASLRMWREYFPNAQIFGADIDADILFQEDRIATFACDQTDAEQVAALWEKIPDVQFDLFIDDGLHTYEAGVALFEHAFHKVREGGIYIIEDVTFESLVKFANYFEGKSFAHEFVTLHRPNVPLGDNSQVIIRR